MWIFKVSLACCLLQKCRCEKITIFENLHACAKINTCSNAAEQLLHTWESDDGSPPLFEASSGYSLPQLEPKRCTLFHFCWLVKNVIVRRCVDKGCGLSLGWIGRTWKLQNIIVKACTQLNENLHQWKCPAIRYLLLHFINSTPPLLSKQFPP